MRIKKRILIFAGAVLFLIILIAVLAIVLLTRNKRIDFPEDTVGNTAGNLNNSGLFCEYNGSVYFSNPYDGGSLYSMDANEANMHKLNSMIVCNLLAGGDSLFYFQLGTAGSGSFENVAATRGFNKSKLDGRNVQSLTRDVIIHAQLAGNYLYLLSSSTSDGLRLIKMRADKSEERELANYEINPSCVANGSIYFAGTVESHSLYKIDGATGAISKAMEANLWFPVYYNGYFYYMDVHNHYRLCRYSTFDGSTEILTNDRVDCYNVGNGYVYYQKNGTDAALICMRDDGTNPQVVAEGNFTKINMTSQYVYFQSFGDDTTVYHSHLGSGAYTVFDAARTLAQDIQLGKKKQ